MNFNSGWNTGGNFNNQQNINIQGNYNFNGDDDDAEDDADDGENEDEEENEEEENYEENNAESETYFKKRNRFILELDEFQYKHVKKYSTIKEDKCAICLQKYKGVDIIKEFPCKHIFHKNCILKWIKSSNKCPLCKYDIANDVNKVELKNYNDDEDEDEQDI
jgi:hypothetical protein